MKPLRLLCVACDVLARPVYLCAAHSPHTVDVTLVRFGLHSTPLNLREILQARIEAADEDGIYDAVVLAYGLCGKATHGLQAGSVPLVVPRAHDCITLFLGGRERFDRTFADCPGTYWFVKDYIERGDDEELPLSIGAFSAEPSETLRAEYVEKYGEDNADYLMDVMGAWSAHYERAAYIELGLGEGESVAERARQTAERRGWRFEQMAGDLVLIRRLLAGDWAEDFLVVPPGGMVEMSGDTDIITTRNHEDGPGESP